VISTFHNLVETTQFTFDMSSTNQKIQEAASQNASLLQGLHETDSAPSQLQQQDAYIRDLDQQIQSINKRVADLKRKTATELKDHEKYRDSNVRRFAHKATGRKEKFAEKAAKEEKEYFEAMQAQKSAEDELAYAQHLISEARTQRQTFSSSADRHVHLQSQLDALYNSIFAGHTPEFPDEDRKEEACNAASHHLGSLNQSLEREKHVLFLLGQTSQKLSEARNHLDGAYNMSTYDMFGGGTMASMQKRNYLERAESAIQQVRMLQDQLKQVAPDIPNLGPLQIAMGSIWSDVVFDNIFSDMQMHDQVKASIAQVDRAGNACGEIIRKREEELGRLQGEVTQADGRLRNARMELQKAREDAFMRVLGNGGNAGGQLPGYAPPSGPPPGYTT
jgi:chromosome segregation ATPase